VRAAGSLEDTGPADAAPAPRHVLLAGLALVVLTLVAYLPVLTDRGIEFLNIDDRRYIVDTPQVTAGLHGPGVAWALTSMHQSNWHPLTWMSWQLDASLYGVHAWGFHVTNVVLHVASAVLLLLVLVRATGSLGRSLTVAALFAVHPLHVESVAWVSERKDVLSTVFFMLAMLAHTHYARRPGLVRYGLVLLLTALGLMAKSMLVTLPCVLLLLDVWPLRRRLTTRVLLEKVPLFALAGLVAILTLRAQSRMMQALPPIPLPVRAGNALVYYVQYVARTLWPVHLTPYHPNRGVSLGALPTLGAAVALVVVTVAFARMRDKRPYALAGWLWFLVTLLPVIGLVQVGFLATADHYTYVPLIGLFLVLVWGGDELLTRLAAPPVPQRLAAIAAVASCAVLLRGQLPVWHDSVALWQHVVDVAPDDAFAHAFLGQALEAHGRDAEAEAQFAMSSQLDEGWKRHDERGLSLERAGDLWGARREFEAVLLTAPHDETAVSHLAVQFQSRGEVPDAIRQYSTLARIRPADAGPEYNLGLLYQQQNELDEARAHWSRALALDPGLADARQRLEATAGPR
jgi:Flp pilus assembly protein TadD